MPSGNVITVGHTRGVSGQNSSSYGPGVSGSSSSGSSSGKSNIMSVLDGGGIGSATMNAVTSLASGSQRENMAKEVAQIATTSASDYADMLREILNESRKNSALSQDMAREQMAFQEKSDNAAMAWSAEEAQKNRDWQEQLSNTAHQREVDDLVAAGLNPILSANNGAYTGSGATGQAFDSEGARGQVDSSTAALGSMFGNIINSATSQGIAAMNNETQRAISEAQLAMQSSLASQQIQANKELAEYNGLIDKYVSDNSLAGSQALAGASRYSADQNRLSSAYTADKALERQRLADANAIQRTVYEQSEQTRRQNSINDVNINKNPMSALTYNTSHAIDTGIDLLKGIFK